jgi:DNA-binding response OmpR family regulator
MPFVLVVDDDPIIRENLCDLFAGEYFCQSAASSEEALVMMDSDRFDVVITDISMPGMSGVELFGQIRQRQPDTPVIVLSGIGDQAYRSGLLNLGAFAYHFKPYKPAEIEASVASAIEHHRRLVAARRRQPGGESKLYVLSMFAAKPNGLASAHEPEVVFASSEAEAKHKGIDQANEKWPRADGWIEHNVIAVEVQPDIISRAASLIPGQD